MSAAAGVSPATVKRALDWGRETGWVVRTRRGARRLAEPDTYALAMPDPSRSPEPQPSDALPSPTPASQLQRPVAVQDVAPDQSVDTGDTDPRDIATMSASEFKSMVLVPSYGVVSDSEMDALRETYWSKLGAES